MMVWLVIWNIFYVTQLKIVDVNGTLGLWFNEIYRCLWYMNFICVMEDTKMEASKLGFNGI